MTSIQSVAFTSRQNAKPENQYTGLKTAAVYTPIAGAAAYGVKKSVDPMTKIIVKAARKLIAENNQIIKSSTGCAGSNMNDHPVFKAFSGGKSATEIIAEYKARNEKLYKSASEMFKLRKSAKSVSWLKSFGMAVPFILGMGLLTDIGNNFVRKHKEPNAVTDKGNAYTKVDIGKKTGFVNGVFAEAALMMLQKDALKKLGSTPAQKIVTLLVGGVGGYILGAIADKMSNDKAAKEADKKA